MSGGLPRVAGSRSSPAAWVEATEKYTSQRERATYFANLIEATLKARSSLLKPGLASLQSNVQRRQESDPLLERLSSAGSITNGQLLSRSMALLSLQSLMKPLD